MADDFSFTITEYLGIVSEGKGDWKLELNKMGKGLTLTEDELKSLAKLIDSLKFDN